MISELNPDGYELTIKQEDTLKAYEWILGLQDKLKNEGKPITVLNLSLGDGYVPNACDNFYNCKNDFLAVQKMNKAGILVVAASENGSHNDAVGMPACLSNTITVGALAAADDPYIAPYSNHSRSLVDILAPGTRIRSAVLVNDAGQPVTDSYDHYSGTSMATPVVSGSFALLIEAYPWLGIDEYKTGLIEMSAKTADRRLTAAGGTGKVFDFTKPVLDFSKFQKPQPRSEKIHIADGQNAGLTTAGSITITSDDPAIIADLEKKQASVIVSGDIKTEGGNAVIAKVGSAEGKFSLAVNGDAAAKDAAIVIDGKSAGIIDILVTHLIRGEQAGILIMEDVVMPKDVPGSDPFSNIRITAYEIEPKNNVIEYAGNPEASDILKRSINYIIRADQHPNGLIDIVDEKDEVWQQKSHGYETANPGQKVYFRLTPIESESFDPDDWYFDIYNKKTGEKLDKTDGGLYFLTVPDGGPVHVYARPVRKPEPPVPYDHAGSFFGPDEMPKTGFSALHPQKLSPQPLSIQYSPTRLTLQLPTLDVMSEIVTVPLTDGEYPVEWLGGSVGMLEGSSLPGEGITVLTGHNHLNTTEAGPFALLSSLDEGDKAMIVDSRGVMQTWRVYESVKIPADGFSSIAGDVKENALVLITCEDESPDGGYLNRRVVLAEQLH